MVGSKPIVSRTPRKDPPSVLIDAIARSNTLGTRTKELYRECVQDFVAFAGSDPQRWNYGAVEDWLNVLLTRGRTIASRDRGACSAQTVGVYRKAVRFASRQYARRSGALDFARDVERVKKQPSAERTTLTYEEVAALLAACKTGTIRDVRDRALLVLAFRSGLRRGGLNALQIENIQPPLITTRNKGGDPITFKGDAETFATLGAWLDILRAANIQRGAVFRDVSRRDNQIGAAMTPYQIWSMFRSRAKQANVRHVFPHLARHTTVTMLREEGRSSAEVSQLTGQTERTIEDIYTHVRTKGAVGDALPSLFGKPKP